MANQFRLHLHRGINYLVGDQVTLHAGWQESAIISAHRAVAAINQSLKATQAESFA